MEKKQHIPFLFVRLVEIYFAIGGWRGRSQVVVAYAFNTNNREAEAGKE